MYYTPVHRPLTRCVATLPRQPFFLASNATPPLCFPLIYPSQAPSRLYSLRHLNASRCTKAWQTVLAEQNAHLLACTVLCVAGTYAAALGFDPTSRALDTLLVTSMAQDSPQMHLRSGRRASQAPIPTTQPMRPMQPGGGQHGSGPLWPGAGDSQPSPHGEPQPDPPSLKVCHLWSLSQERLQRYADSHLRLHLSSGRRGLR